MAESPLTGLDAHLAAVRERALRRLDERANELDAAASDIDGGAETGREVVLRLAHKLRGIGGSIGRQDLTERAGRLEDATRAGASAAAVAEGARRLARACREPRAPVSAPPASKPAPRKMRAFGWRVLVIDDAPATRQLLALTLRAAGCEVESTEDPEVFLGHARSLRPDLVIVDAMMPNTDGLTLHRALRELPGMPIPVVILSAASADDLGWTLPKDPALRWMRKPFRGARLLDSLSDFVDATRT